MSFHPEKCQVIHICSNPRYRRRRQYTLHGHILESVDSAKYLGVHVSQDMSWQTHVNKTAAKASSTLGFLRRNLYSCTQDVRERTYSMFVLPTLKYASATRDLYLTGDVDQLEKVQRCGARYVKNTYHDRSPGCVINMLRDLQWLPLKEQRRAHRLNYLQKIKNREVDIDPGNIIQPGYSRTIGRGRIRQQSVQATVYHQFFYPKTIREWNQLLTRITDIDNKERFKATLDDLLRGGFFVFEAISNSAM